MRRSLGLIFNPISGSGKAAALSQEITELASREGFEVSRYESKPSYAPGELEAVLHGLFAVVVVGGDGTLMALLDALSVSRVPVTMFPAGNESLFARRFGLKPDVKALLGRLRAPQLGEEHFGYVNGRPFFSMVSVGLDSAVIAEIAKRRSSAIGHLGYVMPTLRSLAGFTAPQLTAQVDGKEVIGESVGYLNVANSPAYACELNPVPEARSDLEELKGRFYPHGKGRLSALGFYLGWLPALVRRNGLSTVGSTLLSGKEFLIRSAKAMPVQADGEYVGETPVSVVRAAKRIVVLR